MQLWLSVPIERVVPGDQAFSGQDSEEIYDLSSFVLPQWMVVNFGGQSHTKLIKDSSSQGFDEVYAGISEIMEYIFAGEQNITFTEASGDEWAAARESKSIEVEYAWAFDTTIFSELFGGGANRESIPMAGIKGLTVTLGANRAVYFKDGIKDTIYKLELPESHQELDQLVNRLEEHDPVKYWTLKEIGYSDDNSFYVPLDMSSFNLPVGTAEKELDTSAPAVLDAQASNFFSDMSVVRKITEMDGSVIYTDSQTALLRIDSTGFLEYMVYSYAAGDKNRADIVSAIDAALMFISVHGGYLDNCTYRKPGRWRKAA